ncbi:MAG: MjaI family restriction endonuclease [bacterium]
MKVKISIGEIRRYLDIETPEFPKYVAPLINLANQYAQGTRPKVVGQMSELIQEFEGKTLSEWEKWYLEKKPDAIRNTTEKILQKLKELKNSLNKIDQLSEPDEESKGIDGYIGDIPVSIKPHTYEIKSSLPEHIGIKIIFYRKIDDGIEVDYGEIL